MQGETKNGAGVLVETLLAGDIDVCFANPGTSEMHFVAALDQHEGMRCVLGLFEGVVTGAADGYARMTDKPAATLLHLASGLANGLANMHNARRAQSPMVNIVCEHRQGHKLADSPLVDDVEGTARTVSDWVYTHASADHVNTAPGRIATLVLPTDVAWTHTQNTRAPQFAPMPSTLPADAQFDRALNALRSGEPVVLVLAAGKALRDEKLCAMRAVSLNAPVRNSSRSTRTRTRASNAARGVSPSSVRLHRSMTAWRHSPRRSRCSCDLQVA
ncbi:Thiamine pyrophosphate-requiring enzyme [Candidatus Burkholderia brachyanthoides]|nr:Thiamine pyrophosphate-requiring enzyme [Candidatus Burkholderia brachyanthoides]